MTLSVAPTDQGGAEDLEMGHGGRLHCRDDLRSVLSATHVPRGVSQ